MAAINPKPRIVLALFCLARLGVAVFTLGGPGASVGELFGITHCCPNQFVTIDLSTGALSPLSTVGDRTGSFTAGAAAVDPAGKRLLPSAVRHAS